MKNLCILLLAFLFSGISLKAQQDEPKKGYKFNNDLDLAFSANAKQYASAVSWVHFHPITQKKRFRIGYGIRFTAQGGKNLYYETAPATLTSKQTGPQVLFTKIYYENVDSFRVSSAQNNAVNISINLQYTLRGKFDIGFNIDAAGFSFGNKITGNYISPQDNTNSHVQTARPTSFNLLLVSDNDIGTLNSELYARYWFAAKWAVRAGASFLFTEYTTDKRLRLNNDRWRNKALMGMIGISFSPFR